MSIEHYKCCKCRQEWTAYGSSQTCPACRHIYVEWTSYDDTATPPTSKTESNITQKGIIMTPDQKIDLELAKQLAGHLAFSLISVESVYSASELVKYSTIVVSIGITIVEVQDEKYTVVHWTPAESQFKRSESFNMFDDVVAEIRRVRNGRDS